MKHFRHILVLALLAVCIPATAGAEDVWVWLVGGQSNAPGLVETTDGRAPLSDHLNAKYPGVTHELPLYGDGGTSLHPDFDSFGPSWHPSLMDGVNDSSDSSLYRLLNEYQNTLNSITAAGDTPVTKGFFWMQGYQDSKSGGTHPPQPNASDNYDTRLAALIERVRLETSIPDLPVVIGETCVGPDPDYGEAAYAPVVQAAQAFVAANDPYVWLAETDVSQLGPDDTHFTPDGHYELAGDMVALIPEPTSLCLLAVGGGIALIRRRRNA